MLLLLLLLLAAAAAAAAAAKDKQLGWSAQLKPEFTSDELQMFRSIKQQFPSPAFPIQADDQNLRFKNEQCPEAQSEHYLQPPQIDPGQFARIPRSDIKIDNSVMACIALSRELI